MEVVLSTGAPVERMDFWSGKRYIEVLSLDPAHVNIDRLNSGAPLLDSHSSYSVSDQLGAVVKGSVRLMKNELRAAVQFSRRDAVEGVWQDVMDGLVNSVSIGYRVSRYEESTPKGNALPIRTATDWEVYEASMVSVPADAGAKVRSGESTDGNECEIVTAGYVARAAEEIPAAPAAQVQQQPKAAAVPAVKPKEKPVEDNRSETIVEQQDPPVLVATVSEPTSEQRAAEQETERCMGILQACRAVRLPQAFADKLMKDKTPLSEARGLVLVELEKRGGDQNVPVQAPGSKGGVIVGDDPFVHTRKAIENALLHKVAPQHFKLEEGGQRYRHASLMELGTIFLRARGLKPESMSPMDRAGAALGLDQRSSGMNSTSDFPLLLADVASKALRAAYEAAPQTWTPIAQNMALSDFRARNVLQAGPAPALAKVNEHGEFTHGTIAESKEQVQLETYGKIFSITRQALINDDLGAFARMPASFGQAARNLESNLAWAEITDNADMGDAIDLFHATHGNLDSVGAAISVESIGEGFRAIRVQKDLDGVTPLNLVPRYLIVPAALATKALQFTSQQLQAAVASNINPYAGSLQVIVEARLDDVSDTAWYLAVDVAQAPVMYYATLNGQGGPFLDSRVAFEIDGVEFKARHDVAFKSADWRAAYKNVGVSIT